MKHIRKALSLLLAIALLAMPFSALAQTPQSLYDDAAQAMIEGRYGDAATLYEQLLGYSDAAEMAIYCRALELAEKQDFDTALLALESLGSFKDARHLAAYYRAYQLELAARAVPLETVTATTGEGVLALWRKAIEAYEPIRFYRNSASRMAEMTRVASELEQRLKAAVITVQAQDSSSIYGDRFAVKIDGKWGVMNLQGKLLEECQWDSIGELDGDRIIVQNSSGYGIVDRDFNTLLKCQWNSIGRLDKEYIIVSDKSGKKGLINQQYEVVLPCTWRQVEIVPGADWARVSTSHYSFDAHWGAAALHTGDTLVSASWDKINPLGDRFFAVAREGSKSWSYNYGVVNREGKTVVAVKWDQVALLDVTDSRLTGDYLRVQSDKSFGLYAADGTELIPAQYSLIRALGGALLVRTGSTGSNYRFGLVSPEGKVLVPCELKGITEAGDCYILQSPENRYGLVSAAGETLVPCEMKKITVAGDCFILQDAENRYGLVSATGETLLPRLWERITASGDRLIVRQSGQYGLMTLSGQEITPPQWNHISAMGSGLFRVKQGNLYGVMDSAGKLLVPCTYREIFTQPDELGRYSCTDNFNRHGALDASMALVIPCQYPSDVYFNAQGQALILDNAASRMYLIDQTGRELTDAVCQRNTYTLRVQNGLWGLEQDGKTLLECRYDYIEMEHDRLAIVQRGGMTGMADTLTGQEVLPCEWSASQAQPAGEFRWDYVQQLFGDLAVIRRNGLYGVLRLADTQLLIPCEWEELQLASENVALVERNRLYGAVSVATGAELVPVSWQRYDLQSLVTPGSPDLLLFQNVDAHCLLHARSGVLITADEVQPSGLAGTLLLKQGDLYGVMNSDGEMVTECKWPMQHYLEGHPDMVVLQEGDHLGLLNLATGKQVLPCEYDRILSGEGYNAIVVKKDDLYGLATPDGKLAAEAQYDDITVLRGDLYLLRFEQGDDTLYRLINGEGDDLLGRSINDDDLVTVDHADGILLLHENEVLHLYTLGSSVPLHPARD